MTDYYIDRDTGTDGGSDGLSWANADATLEYSLDNRGTGGGHRHFFQAGTTDDTTTAQRDPTCKGTYGNPTLIYGVKDGTSAVPPVVGDFAVRGTDTLPVFGCITTAGVDIQMNGYYIAHGINFTAVDTVFASVSVDANTRFVGCEINATYFPMNKVNVYCEAEDCEINLSFMKSDGNNSFATFTKCTITTTHASLVIQPSYDMEFYGCDFSGCTATVLMQAGSLSGRIKMFACKLKASWSNGARNTRYGSHSMVACSSATAAKAVGTSYQDFLSGTIYGEVEDAPADYRTGGADDGGTGVYALAMTPFVDVTQESGAALVSPPLNVWVAGGSQTLTIYIANDSGADFNEDDVSVRWLTPDPGDHANHDYITSDNTAGSLAHLFPSTTALTDDAVSTWNGSAANGQKLAITVTPGFTGWVQAIVEYRKRYAASPKILYVDPRIIVT